MRLSPVQQQVSDDPHRFRVVCAGRRWGKTWLSMNDMARFSCKPHSRVLYVAPTYKLAKGVMWEELKSQLYSRNWIRKVNESELTIWLVNSSVICLRSAENRDALRGGKWDFITLDEVQDIHPDTWLKVLRPTLSDRQGAALFIGTPKGVGSWFYDVFIQASQQPDWSSHQFTTLQGGHVPPEEIEAARRDLDEKTFRQEYEASFESYTGVVFYNYADHIHQKPSPEVMPNQTLWVGMDFNRDPMTAVVGIKLQDSMHILRDYEIWGSNTHEMAQVILTDWGQGRDYITWPDATGSRLNTNSAGFSDHLILKQAGFQLRCGKTNPNVIDSINTVNSVLKNHSGVSRFSMDPGCKRLRDSMLKYVYQPGTRTPLKNGHDHFCDALRYLIHGEFNITRGNTSAWRTGARAA